MSNIDQPDKADMDAVSRAYRDARDKDARNSDGMLPPPALDDAIRAAARRAVHAGPQPIGKTWLRTWTPQLAVAAVVVLSVSVVFVSVEERPDLAPAPIQKIALNHGAEAPGTVKAKAPLETSIVQEVAAPQVKLDTADARDTRAARNVMEKKAMATPADSITESQVARDKTTSVAKQELSAPRMSVAPPASLAAATPVAPPVYAPPAQPLPSAPARGSVPAAAPRFVPPPEVHIATPTAPAAPAPFPGTVAEAPSLMRKEARADAGATVVVAAEPKAVSEKIEVSGSRIAVAGSVRSRDAADTVTNAPAKPASVAAVSAPVITATTSAAQAAPESGLKHLAPPPAPAVPATSANTSAWPTRALEIDAPRKGAQLSESAGARAFSKDDHKLADNLVADERPGPWLKRLQELRDQGKLKELREELVRFKKRHPDVVLPKSLTELITD